MQLELGNNIRQLRRQNKTTQEQLAEALGVTAQAVSRWESGGSYPDMNLNPSIANFLGCPLMPCSVMKANARTALMPWPRKSTV